MSQQPPGRIYIDDVQSGMDVTASTAGSWLATAYGLMGLSALTAMLVKYNSSIKKLQVIYKRGGFEQVVAHADR